MKRNLTLLLTASLLGSSALAQNNLPDDYPNNPPGFMLPITPNGTASANGRINYADDRDVFSFIVGSNSTLTVYTTGNTDTNGVLRRLSSTGSNTTLISEEGGTGNFRITRNVEPGQFSISVGGRIANAAGTVGGEYGLRVELTPVAPPPGPPDIDIPGIPRGGSVSFGAVALNSTTTRSFTIGNTGQSNLVITGITLATTATNGQVGNAGPFFIEGGASRTVAPGASVSAAIVFRPVTAGSFTAVVNAVSNDPDESPWTFTVTGSTASEPPPPPPEGGEIGVALGGTDVPTGGTVDFGAMTIPSTAPVVRELLISNTGDTDLRLGAVTISLLPLGSPLPSAPEGFFRVLTPPASILAPGRSTVLRLGAGGNANSIIASSLPRYAAHAVFENSDSDENPYRLLLTAEVNSPPPPAAGEIEVASGDAALENNGVLDFGTTATGTPVRKTVTIKNTGEGELRIAGITVEWSGPIIAIFPPPPPPFRVDGVEPRVVAPGASTSCVVTFPATSAGFAESLLRIQNNDSDENPFTLTLKAVAEGDPVPPPTPEIAVSLGDADVPQGGTVDFGRTSLTVPVRKTLMIANSGRAPLQVRAAFQAVTRGTNTALPFRLSGEPFASVPPGTSRALTVVFQPVTNGTFQATLVISNNDADENPYRIRVSGQGGTDPAAVPDINLTLGDAPLPMNGLVDFGTAAPGASVTKEIVIGNNGQGDLRLGRISFLGNSTEGGPAVDPAVGANGVVILPPVGALHFRALPPANNVVPAGRSAVLRVVYTAPPSGGQQVVLSIESNDPDENPWRLNLRGASSGTPPVAPEIAVSSGDAELPIGGVLDFGTVAAGSQVRREITVSNSGGSDLRILGFSIIPAEFSANDALVFLPPPALVRVVSGPGVISPGARGVFVLEMLAFSQGHAVLNARITNNDPNENPYSFRITGNVLVPPVDPDLPDDPAGGAITNHECPRPLPAAECCSSAPPFLAGAALFFALRSRPEPRPAPTVTIPRSAASGGDAPAFAAVTKPRPPLQLSEAASMSTADIAIRLGGWPEAFVHPDLPGGRPCSLPAGPVPSEISAAPWLPPVPIPPAASSPMPWHSSALTTPSRNCAPRP